MGIAEILANQTPAASDGSSRAENCGMNETHRFAVVDVGRVPTYMGGVFRFYESKFVDCITSAFPRVALAHALSAKLEAA